MNLSYNSWLRIGSNALVAFATAAAAATATGHSTEGLPIALLNAVFIGLIVLGTEIQNACKGQQTPLACFLTVF